MNILLASVGFKNNDIVFNKNQIINTIKDCSKDIDLIVFGESFLQGFDALNWDFELDKNIAITRTNKIIKEICSYSRKKEVAVSFGYYELYNNSIYSSQIVIDKFGKIIFNYRRISKGWRILNTDFHYKEGEEFSTFNLENKNIAIALCGDLWFKENLMKMLDLHVDVILWPSYTDFNYERWNNIEKYKYAKQVSSLKSSVLYVNPYCLDSEEFEIAKGGAAYFSNGKIVDEIPSGIEGILVIHL